MYSACARRTSCKYPGCDLKPYLDSRSATTFKKRRKKNWPKMKQRRQSRTLRNRNVSKNWPCLSHSPKRLHCMFSWITLWMWLCGSSQAPWLGNSFPRQLFHPDRRMREKFPATIGRQGLLPFCHTSADGMHVCLSALTYVSPRQMLLLIVRYIQV